jgi:hypothetical protein
VAQDTALINKDDMALSLFGADIKRNASLTSLVVIGEVTVSRATIGGTLSVDGSRMINPGGLALTLVDAHLTLVDLTPAAVAGAIGLGLIKINALITPKDMAVLKGSELFAPGWVLGDVLGGIRHDRHAAAHWLRGDTSVASGEEFVAQPCHELANVYDRYGQPADARWMRWQAAQGVTRTSPWWSKPIRWTYGALTGHGYYPLIAAGWLILAIFASWLIVTTHEAAFTPAASDKVVLRALPRAGQIARVITGATPCNTCATDPPA